MDYLFARYGGVVMVERFITGREIHASVCQFGPAEPPTALPLAEIRFEPDETLWPIYSYDAKWKEQSREYQLRPVDIPARLPEDVAERVRRASVQTHRVLGCRDYSRVDLRVAPDGEVFVLEGNPNPSITSLTLETGLDLIGKKKMQPVRAALAWTLGRLGTRMPLYGPLNVVVPVDTASAWLARLMDERDGDANDVLAVMQMARRTDDRYRDIDDALGRLSLASRRAAP